MSGLSPTVQNPPRKRPLPPLVLWLGVLIADWCIMAQILLIGAMMSSGWVGASSHPPGLHNHTPYSARVFVPDVCVNHP